VIGVLWALGLWLAAPVMRLRAAAAPYGYADRLRDAIVIGIALPLVLGALNVLWPLTLAIALLALIAAARLAPAPPANEPIPIVSVATLAFLAWPALTRPPLDGDTVWYHLPNAASWVHAHGIWITNTHYWWYPPASELFASGLYALGGGAAVGIGGLAAMALLAARIVTWSRERCGCSPLLADLLGAATIASLPLALQAATMQNDVWQAAFVLEILWNAGRAELRVDGMVSTIVCALLKPDGWLYALVALAASRARLPYWFAWLGAVTFLFARSFVLEPGALFPISFAGQPHGLGTSIAGHGPGAILFAFAVMGRIAPLAAVALAAAVAGPFITRGRDRSLGAAALASAVIFFLTPWGFADAHPQLATGASLRYADPAIAAGVLVLAPYARRFELASVVALALCIVYGCFQIGAIFWNDQTTRAAIPVALVCAGGALLARRFPFALGAAATVCLLFATWHASQAPAQYYADALSVNGTDSGVFGWIARTQPPRVAVLGFPPGTIAQISPDSWLVETTDDDACATARAHGAMLIAMTERTRSPQDNARRLATVRACGPVVYSDGIATAVVP
jgi:hypothetical protein